MLQKRIMAGILIISTAIGLNTFYLLSSKPVQAQVTSQPPENAYLVIHGIKGDSQTMKGAIDISHVSFQNHTGGAARSPGALGPISFEKNYDSTTTQLLTHLTTGKSVTGDVYYARSIFGSKPVVYYDLQFSGVLSSDHLTDVGETIEITPSEERVSYGGLLGPLAGNLPEVTRAAFLPIIAILGVGIYVFVRKRKAKQTHHRLQ